jgi:hypothetical protein
MHLDNAFVRYLCVIIFKLFLVIQIMRIFLKIENLGILMSFSIAWRVDRVESRNRWLEVNFELSQEIDIEYLGRVRMLISKSSPTISLITLINLQMSYFFFRLIRLNLEFIYYFKRVKSVYDIFCILRYSLYTLYTMSKRSLIILSFLIVLHILLMKQIICELYY